MDSISGKVVQLVASLNKMLKRLDWKQKQQEKNIVTESFSRIFKLPVISCFVIK